MAALPSKLAAQVPTFTLSNSIKIPAIAYGSGTAWFYSGGNNESSPLNTTLVDSLKTAIQTGYLHLDAAEIYGTEREVGVALKESGLPREAFFVTSKIYPSLEKPSEGLQNTLLRLGLSYLDLYLIHAPFKFKNLDQMKQAWQALEEEFDGGRVMAIGVSNFRVDDLKQLLSFARVKPVVNQVEFHPYCQASDIAAFCNENGIKLAAYSPLASMVRAPGGPVDPVVNELSIKYGKTPAQVLLRWVIDKGVIAVTTTSKEARMKEFIAVNDFQLSDEDIEKVDHAGSQLKKRIFWEKEFESSRNVQ